MEKRENFSSRLGFILISAGCAVGLGNVWRFPYITGKYGIRSDLSAVSCDPRPSHYGNGIFRRTGQPEICCQKLSHTGTFRYKVALPFHLCHRWQLSAHDVLYNSRRMDALLCGKNDSWRV